MNVLPLFKSQYSLGRSILTLTETNKEGVISKNYPVSIFDIAKVHGLKEVVVVDNSISGFLEAYTNSRKAGVKLIFGLQLSFIADIAQKSEDSIKTRHKAIVLAKRTTGYKKLMKISSIACTKGFYYRPNIDFHHLKKLWSDDLLLVIPFYDSFLHKNNLNGGLCVPDFSFAKPTFLIENHGGKPCWP